MVIITTTNTYKSKLKNECMGILIFLNAQKVWTVDSKAYRLLHY